MASNNKGFCWIGKPFIEGTSVKVDVWAFYGPYEFENNDSVVIDPALTPSQNIDICQQKATDMINAEGVLRNVAQTIASRNDITVISTISR